MRTLLNKIALVGDKLLTVMATTLAVLMMSYSAYAMEDSLLTQRNAYAGEDLLQYRPDVEAGEKVSFASIRKVNPDVNSWLTIYDTNINYPVVQGEDDLHYAHTDLYGKSSLTGAIYLSALNGSDYSDQYNVIYGHHMDNGAMFGDVDNYLDASWLDAHRKGVLITTSRVYDIDVFAGLETDAYESAVYGIEANNAGGMEGILSYLREMATVYREPTGGAPAKLLVLSTCLDTETSGRVVAVAALTPRSDYDDTMFAGLTGGETIEDDRTPLAGPRRSEWALLDLVCLLFTVYVFLPVDALFAKFGRGRWLRRAQQAAGVGEGAVAGCECGADPKADPRRYRRRLTVAGLVELAITVASVLVFVLNESMLDPMTVIDKWTPLMIALLVACWVVDVAREGDGPIHLRREAVA